MWPPAPTPTDVGPPADASYWKDTPPPSVSAADSIDVERARGPFPAFRQIEAAWLGLVRPTLADRMIDAAWTPDAPDRYCPRCAASVGPHEAGPDGCAECHAARLPWARAVRLSEYAGLIREVVHEIKFTAWRRLGVDAGRLLGHALAARLRDTGIDPSVAVVIPVPSTTRRRLARGIDHTLALARGVRAATGMTIAPALRRKHRPSQTSMAATTRWRNVAGTMSVKGRFDLRQRPVILLDDVRTTGATLTEAARAVRKSIRDRALRHEQPFANACGPIWIAVLAVPRATDRRPAQESPTSL